MEPAGQSLGRYELVRKLASGGMGEVYLGAVRGAAGFEKPVAIKRILPHLAGDGEFVRRFIDEARIVVTLHHGNIVPVLDMGEQGGEYFIAMEYLPGHDLRAVLRRAAEVGQAIPPGVALYVAAEICRGLAYAHRKADEQGRELGIVHRDVSPSNVLVSWEGLVKLTDFGVARAVGRSSESLAGSLRGKVSYMSPEQASGGALDRRSDIYSAGIVLWEMLTGRRLYDGGTDPEVLRKAQEGQAPPPSSVVPGLHAGPAIDAVLMRALARAPADRYGRTEELEQDLQRLLFSEFDGQGARALAEHLRRMFPGEAGGAAAPPTLDEALQAGLPELGRDAPGEATASARAAPAPPADTATQWSVTGPAPTARSVRRLLLAAAVGLLAGWLAWRPAGPPQGALTVESDPPGALVLLAGRGVGVTPWRGAGLPAGEMVDVEVVADDRPAWRDRIAVPQGGLAVVRAELAPPAQSPAPPASARALVEVLPLLHPGPPPWRRGAGAPSADPLPRGRPADRGAAGAHSARPGTEAAQSAAPAAPVAPAAPAARGTLSLRVKPWGVVVWRGQRYSSPVTRLEMPAGTHTVRVEHPDWGVAQEVLVEIRPGEETTVLVPLKQPASP